MRIRPTVIVLAAAVAGAGIFALVTVDHSTPAAPQVTADLATAAPDQAGAGSADPHAGGQNLPPNHPAVGNRGHGGFHGGAAPSAEPEPLTIAWKTPDAWKSLPNPNPMRVATAHVPAAPGAADDAELAVSRAGGAIDANISRWKGQFEDPGKDSREEKTVSGMKVTVVSLSGTYVGGGPSMGSNTSEPHKNWTMLAAIVEAQGQQYFFKLTGPTASVQAARPGFDAMVASIKPTAS